MGAYGEDQVHIFCSKLLNQFRRLRLVGACLSTVIFVWASPKPASLSASTKTSGGLQVASLVAEHENADSYFGPCFAGNQAMKKKIMMMHVLSIIRILVALLFPDVKRAAIARTAGSRRLDFCLCGLKAAEQAVVQIITVTNPGSSRFPVKSEWHRQNRPTLRMRNETFRSGI